MKKITLTKLQIENFKGISNLSIEFSHETSISGRNASGKSTIADAFSWLLFDKDTSGSSNFAIRPKDADGRDIDNLEIKVEGTLDIDGETITLTKVQKQKWTKHRGSTAPTFEGNVNEYQVNGFPAKKSEYEQRIHDLIDEGLFKLITNPRTFAAMKWQDQRKTLLEFVSEITDEDVLATDIRYEPISGDVLAAGADKAREKANALLRTLKKQQDEYPVRIDEAMRNLGNLPDEDYLISQKREVNAELTAIQKARNSLSTASNTISDIQNQIMDKRRKMDEIGRQTAADDYAKNMQSKTEADTGLMHIKEATSEKTILESTQRNLEKEIKKNRESIEALKVRYKETATRKFPEDQTICPTCGRPFEADRIAEIKSEFVNRTKELVELINKEGQELGAKIKAQKTELESIKKRIEGFASDIEGMTAKWESLDRASKQQVHTDYTQFPEYKQLQEECKELEMKLASMSNNDDANKALDERERAARASMDEIAAGYAKIESDRKTQERIKQLKEDQMDCSQKVADQEQIVYLLDEYAKAKMDLLSGKINSHFKKVRFRLFTEQINGGVKEICTMQINTNGSYVDYYDANNAAKILGGLDVIEALSELYDVEAPIFLDNAEAIDSYNIPEMDAQLILLEVSDDKELHVERG